jgi:hypothetical protein
MSSCGSRVTIVDVKSRYQLKTPIGSDLLARQGKTGALEGRGRILPLPINGVLPRLCARSSSNYSTLSVVIGQLDDCRPGDCEARRS